MRPRNLNLGKLLVIVTALLIINFALLPSYQNAQAASLKNKDLWPELGYYWVYKRTDHENGYIYNYNISMKGEKTIQIANENVTVMILEGSGNIIKWPAGVKSTDFNEIYIKMEINKEDMEIIKYTQHIDLEFFEEGKSEKTWHHQNETHNYLELTKPNDIILGSSWVKQVKTTQIYQYKQFNDTPEDGSHIELINSTVKCNKLEPITVPAGTFDTFNIVENQYIREQLEKTVNYYYSKDAMGYVKKVRKNALNVIEETEELEAYGSIKTADGNDVGEDGDGNASTKDDSAWFDLQDRNVQILIGIICIIIATSIIGYASYKKKKKSEK